MEITIAYVMSINGKITNDNLKIPDWSSKEDKVHFSNMINSYDLVVMGSKTFDEIKNVKIPKHQLRIVMTRNPDKFGPHEGVEFTSDIPEVIVENMKKRGYTKLLIAGGSKTSSLFLDKGLIDKMFLTVEPKIFANGVQLFSDVVKDSEWILKKSTVMNEKGSLLLEYEHIK